MSDPAGPDATATPAGPDAYLAAAPERFLPLLEELRARLAAALPDAEEFVGYGMPGFRIDGAIVAGYAAFSRQCGLYVDAAAIAEHAGEIIGAGLKHTKTGVTFTVARPIPGELVTRLALASRAALGV